MPSVTAPGTQFRFESLDGWRGLCAVAVAMFHLEAYSHFYAWSFLRNSYLFVDFFFVLSGFVITATYRTKLLSDFSVWHFMLLRWGRLYPLHICILMAFIGIELARVWFSGALGGAAGDKFVGAHSVGAILTNMLLIQSLHVHGMLTWNLPSWSISVEFYTYLVFAIALIVLARRIYILIAAIVLVGSALLLYLVHGINTDYEFGFIRCLVGFFMGIACYDIYLFVRLRRLSDTKSLALMTAVEVCNVTLVVVFICWFGQDWVSVAAPFVFGVTVIIFSLEGGAVSEALKLPPFNFLGRLSYSIYMVHALMLIIMGYAVRAAEREWHVVLLRDGYFGATQWEGDLAYVVLIILVIGASCFTFRSIEEPGRTMSRKLAKRIFGSRNSPTLKAIGSTEHAIMTFPGPVQPGSLSGEMS
jgi:peptidoglycan/LPS O-acetylase OafA/YrhL